MGRKSCNKIIKELDPVKEQEKLDDEAELLFIKEEKKEMDRQKILDNELDIVWNTRCEMLEYCNDSCIPLCDHLTMDMFQKFVKFVQHS